MMSKRKILVAVPGFAGIQPESQESYVGAMFRAGRNLTQYDFGFIVPTKREQFRARNYIVDRAIAGEFEYLLMLDDDHIIQPDLIERLVQDMDENPSFGVIGGLYYQRGGTYEPVVMRRKNHEPGDWSFEYVKFYEDIITRPGFYEVDIIGGGCMMFRTEVFNKILPPYFWWEYQVGTDIAICGRLQDAGVRIGIDTRLELGHLGNKTIITSRTVGGVKQKLGQINKQLRSDVLDYTGLSELELDREMAHAAEPIARQRKWKKSVGDSQEWDDVKRYYQDHGNWHITNLLHWNLQYDRFKEMALRLLDGKIQAGDRVLDYGPGIGHMTIPFLQAGCYVDTIEIVGSPTTAFVEWRANKIGAQDCLSTHPIDAGEVPACLEKKFKAALLISVIDHLTDPYGVIQWITDHMEIGGYFVCDYIHVGSDEKNPQHLDRIDTFTFANHMQSLGWETSPEDLCLFIYRGGK